MLKENPTRIYLVIGGGRALFNALVFTINLIYQVQTVGLNPLQMVLVGTVLEVTVLLFEVPTGAVADVYSRRLSVLIGLALVGCGFLLEGSIPLFWAVLGAQVLWGIGYTFVSGALQAWLADEIGVEAAGPVFLRSAQVELIAGLVGTGASAWLARRWLQLPILFGGALYIALAAFMALIMPERGFRPTPAEERETWKQMAATARAGLHAVRGNPALRIVVGLSLVTGLYSEGYDRLWTPHLLDSFNFPALFGLDDAVIWFGIIGMGATMTGIVANELARRGRATEERARTINWLTLLYTGCCRPACSSWRGRAASGLRCWRCGRSASAAARLSRWRMRGLCETRKARSGRLSSRCGDRRILSGRPRAGRCLAGSGRLRASRRR